MANINDCKQFIQFTTPHNEIATIDYPVIITTDMTAPVQLAFSLLPEQNLHNMSYPYPPGSTINLIVDGIDINNGYIANSYLDSDGNIVSSTTMYISEFFTILPNTVYTWSGPTTLTLPALCFYDENKNFLESVISNGELPKTITSPSTAAYCRTCQYITTTTENIVQLEIGSVATTPRKLYSNICEINGSTQCNIAISAGENLIPSNIDYATGKWKPTNGVISGSVYKCCYFRVPKCQLIWQAEKTGTPYVCLMDEPIRNGAKTYNAVTTTNRQYWSFDNSVGHPYMAIFGGSDSVPLQTYLENTGMRVSPKISKNYSNTSKQTIIPINFTDTTTGETILAYKGVITVNYNGSVDFQMTSAIYNMGTLNWKADSSAHIFTYTFSVMPILSSQNFTNWIYCSIYHPVQASSLGTLRQKIQHGEIWGRNTYRSLWIKDNRYNTAAQFIAGVNGQTIIVPRETPLNYHFNNVDQLVAFFGKNTIWTTAGTNITANYWKHNL